MTENELLALLNIKPTQSPSPNKGGVPATSTPRPIAGAPGASLFSDTALSLDRWDLDRGSACLKNSPRARQAGLNELEMADFHSCAFLDEPAPVENCTDSRRLEYVSTLLESPDLASLRVTTLLDPLASELAATELGVAYAQLKQEDAARRAKPSKDPVRDERKAEGALLRAVGRALEKAGEAVEDLGEMCDALGCGPGDWGGGQLDLERVRKLYNHTKDDAQLKRIAELAGRYIRVAMAKQRRKVIHGYDDVVGVELGGDVEKLTPLELASLADPDLEDDATRRLVERQCLQREHRGTEPVGRGPIVCVVDKSGSMGARCGEFTAIEHAKAFALALYRIARHQKRWMCLVSFAGGREGHRLAIPPDKPNEAALLNWLKEGASGGTSLDVPCDELPRVYWPEFVAKGMPKGKTDLIMVTDGEVIAPPDVVARFADWKKTNTVRAFGVMVGCGPGGLKDVLDEWHTIPSFDPANQFLGEVMSL